MIGVDVTEDGTTVNVSGVISKIYNAKKSTHTLNRHITCNYKATSKNGEITLKLKLLGLQKKSTPTTGNITNIPNVVQDPNELALDCVAQCNAHYHKHKDVSSYKYPKFKEFLFQSASQSEGKNQLLAGMTKTRQENQSTVGNVLKGCVRGAFSMLGQKCPEVLNSCHNRCDKILEDLIVAN